jgi:hypothetical protein
MKKIILLSLTFFSISAFQAQVGIGTFNPNASAALDVDATNKGFLAPRVALTSNSDVATIATPATGLMIYNTATAGTSPNAVVPGYYYYSGLKWERLVTTTPETIVNFNTSNPSTGSPSFTPNNPASANYIYVSTVDASQWIWNGSTYVTFVAPSSTPFYIAGTTNDAGNNKTANIWRTGSVGIGTNNPLTTLQVTNPLTATTTVNANAQVLRLSRPTTSGLKWDNIAQFNLGSYSTAIAANSRLDLALTDGGNATTLTNVMTWLANGNVGINNTAPSAPLVVQGLTGTGVLKLISATANPGDNWWMGFGHSSNSTDANDRARIGVDILSGGSGRLFFTTGAPNAQIRAIYIDESQRIGIGTSSPAAQLHSTGTVRFAGAGTPGVGKVLTSDASGNAAWQYTTINAKTAAYTLITSDYGNVIVFNSATNVTLTIPSSLPAGFYCQVIQQGTGQVSVIGASGVTVTSALGTLSRTTGSSIGILLSTPTNAFLSGDTSF